MEARTSENAPRFGELSKLLPVVVVISMIVFLYVEYVFLHCMRLLQMDMPHFYRKKDDVARAQLQLVVFHFFTFLLFYCFGKCVLTFPGTVPDGAGWDLSDTSTSEAHAVASFTEKKHTGERRHCKWCLKFKPDRCHHCRVCNVCVVKMDHHCPWVYNCIGFKNHKYFFLLLVYTAIDLIIITVTMFDSVWWATRTDVNIAVLVALGAGEVLATFLTVLTVGFLCFHIWLMLKAMTTVEFCEKSLKKASYNSSIYSLGFYGNTCAVLGNQPLLWLVPFSLPVGDGMTWKKTAAGGSSRDSATAGDADGGPFCTAPSDDDEKK